MLAHRPDIRRILVLRRSRVALLAAGKKVTSLPEFVDLKAKDLFKGRDPNTLPGIASGRVGSIATSLAPWVAGEENSAQWGETILVHEPRPRDPPRRARHDPAGRGGRSDPLLLPRGAPEEALRRLLRRRELRRVAWAEVSVAWLDVDNWSFPPTAKTREGLKKYDPDICPVLAAVYGDE